MRRQYRVTVRKLPLISPPHPPGFKPPPPLAFLEMNNVFRSSHCYSSFRNVFFFYSGYKPPRIKAPPFISPSKTPYGSLRLIYSLQFIEILKKIASGAPNDGFLPNALKRCFRLSGVLLKLSPLLFEGWITLSSG